VVLTPDIPDLTGDRLEILEQAMQWVHRRVVRNLPDEDWIWHRFLRRTVAEVLADGYTLAYNPCVDRTLLTQAILGAHGIDSYVILHDSATGLWHLVMELQREDGSWVFADYGTRESRLYPGRYRYALAQQKPSRLMRMRAPKYGPQIWDSRPPLRLLAGMKADLARRFARFAADLYRYQDELAAEKFSLEDRLIRDPDQSVYGPVWRAHPVVSLGTPAVDCVDMPDVHLFLEWDPSR
jgi:hypothetical protein